MDAKEKIIKGITRRILDEHRKHIEFNWAEYAAAKIYATYIEKLEEPKTKFNDE